MQAGCIYLGTVSLSCEQYMCLLYVYYLNVCCITPQWNSTANLKMLPLQIKLHIVPLHSLILKYSTAKISVWCQS